MMVADIDSLQIYLFGGSTTSIGGELNDLWIYSIGPS